MKIFIQNLEKWESGNLKRPKTFLVRPENVERFAREASFLYFFLKLFALKNADYR